MNIGFQTSGLSGFTRVAYLWRRHASAVLWIAMAALLPTACSDDAEQSVPQANGHTAVIYLNFKTGASKQAAEMNTSQSSETRAPLTRAIDENGIKMDAVYFGEAQEFVDFVQAHDTISVTYYPEINVFQGRENLQVVIKNYC